MISEHRRFGGGLFGPWLRGTRCRSACQCEIGRENERCFDPAFVLGAQFIRKQWPRIEEQIAFYSFIPWFLFASFVGVRGGRLWRKIIVWGILFWDKTILWMLLKLGDVILSSNSFEVILVFNQQQMGKKATPISRSTDIPSWSCLKGI
jgi:hypothetical protein